MQVAGTTPTQAVLVYDAPAAGTVCRVEVSESPTYSPLVPDVDPSLFPGSDQDSRQGVVSGRLQRIFVVGKHGMNSNAFSNLFLAADGKRHSRALQAGAEHYYRITCGDSVMTGAFTTAVVPPGSTYGEVAPVDATHPGAYNWPDLDPADRGERVVDPATGNLIRKITTPADTDPFVSSWTVAGSYTLCSHVPIPYGDSTYYTCYIPSNFSGTLVSINTSTGDALPLTSLTVPYRAIGNEATLPCTQPVFDGATGTRFYCIAGMGGKALLLMGDWTGPVNAASSGFTAMSPNPALHWTNLTPAPNDLSSLLARFDPTFTPGLQAHAGYYSMVGQQRGKIIMRLQPNQDASGWILAFDPGNNQSIGSGGSGGIVAALPVWKAPASRWCGLHNSIGDGDNMPWVSAVPDTLGLGGVYLGGPYSVTVSGPAGGSISPSDTVFTITPTDGIYEPTGPDPVGPDGYLQDAQPGDLFFLDVNHDGAFNYAVDEYIELISKDPVAHTWTVRRANQMNSSPFYAGTGLSLWTTTATSAPAGSRLYAACRTEPLSTVASATLWWNFETDPHGQNIVLPAVNGATSPEVIEQTHTGGHMVTRDDQNAMASWGCFSRTDACWTTWTQTGGVPGLSTVGPPLNATATPAFEGAQAPGGSNVYQQHPSYEQVNAPPAERSWLLDRVPLVWGSGTYGVSHLVAGTTSVYKVSGATLHRDRLGTLATCGTKLLRDVSSPATGTRIGDATPYTYCVARKDSECMTGATAGDVYVSCPDANYRGASDPTTTIQCAGWTLWGSQVDICVGDVWPYAQSVVQAGFSSSLPNGELNRVITQGFGRYHEQGSEYDNALATPDGRWAMFYSTVEGSGQAYLAKIPPQPLAPSAIRHDGFIPVTLSLKPPSGLGGVDNAIVEFGYVENGGPSDYFCTSRQETCMKGSQPGNTYGWAGDTVAGQPCASGCSIAVPLIPNRIAYFQVKYRDAANNVLGLGETGTLTESGASILKSPGPVRLSPTAPTLDPAQSQQFQLADDLGPVPTDWSITPAVGSISASGLYTAPSTLSADQSVTVTATDAGDPARSTTAAIALKAPAGVAGTAGFSWPVRINAGGPAIGADGASWAADSNFSGGATWSVAGVSGVPAIYNTVRYGDSFHYSFQVPNGSYTVILKFAEVTQSRIGDRVFNVAINGTAVLTNFDILAAASGMKMVPVDKAFPVTVPDGNLVIAFSKGPANSPMINAIEIVPFAVAPANAVVSAGATLQCSASAPVVWSLSAPVGTISADGLYTAPAALQTSQPVVITATSTTNPDAGVSIPLVVQPAASQTFSPIRINAGGPAYTDSQNQTWAADSAFTGGLTWSTTMPVSGTTMSPVLQTVRYGNLFSYGFTVPDGSYTVNLYFAEVSQPAAGMRQFNVTINGTPVLTNFDVYAESGGMLQAIVRSFPVTVTGGAIRIQFSQGPANSPMVSAIEIY